MKKTILQDMIMRNGLTQKEFAEMLKVSTETIRLWSLGKYEPTLSKSILATKILNCSIEQFAKACKVEIAA